MQTKMNKENNTGNVRKDGRTLEAFSKAKDKNEKLSLLELAICEEVATYRKFGLDSLSLGEGKEVRMPSKISLVPEVKTQSRYEVEVNCDCDALQTNLLTYGRLLSQNENLDYFKAYCSIVAYLIDQKGEGQHGLFMLKDAITSRAFYAEKLQEFEKMVKVPAHSYEAVMRGLEAMAIHLNAW